jgi:DNA-binding MarR family transcriptional regulator
MKYQDAGQIEAIPDQQLRELIGHFALIYQGLMVTRPSASVPDPEVSHKEFQAVLMLGIKDWTTMGEVARVLHLPLSTATNVADRLLAKGLVERERSVENRRTVRVGLTAKGREVYQHFVEFQLTMARNMLGALRPGEREIFLELMAKMTRPVAPETERQGHVA